MNQTTTTILIMTAVAALFAAAGGIGYAKSIPGVTGTDRTTPGSLMLKLLGFAALTTVCCRWAMDYATDGGTHQVMEQAFMNVATVLLGMCAVVMVATGCKVAFEGVFSLAGSKQAG